MTIVSLYYKKSSPFDTIEISIKCLPFFCIKNWLTCIQVIGLLIYNDESVSVHGAHFKPRCNFLPSYSIMLLLGHERL